MSAGASSSFANFAHFNSHTSKRQIEVITESNERKAQEKEKALGCDREGCYELKAYPRLLTECCPTAAVPRKQSAPLMYINPPPPLIGHIHSIVFVMPCLISSCFVLFTCVSELHPDHHHLQRPRIPTLAQPLLILKHSGVRLSRQVVSPQHPKPHSNQRQVEQLARVKLYTQMESHIQTMGILIYCLFGVRVRVRYLVFGRRTIN